jgi:superoxide dismutase, Cu-Zn family
MTRSSSQGFARVTLALATVLVPITARAASSYTAELKTRDGTAAGRVDILAAPGGAFLRLKLTGLSAGGHAIKIHETGKCDGDFASAGAILNPLGAGLGLLNDLGPAAGDLPNVFAASTGEAEAEFASALLQPGAGDGDTLSGEDGSAVVIYDKPDDHMGLTDAGPGERIACGILQPGK